MVYRVSCEIAAVGDIIRNAHIVMRRAAGARARSPAAAGISGLPGTAIAAGVSISTSISASAIAGLSVLSILAAAAVLSVCALSILTPIAVLSVFAIATLIAGLPCSSLGKLCPAHPLHLFRQRLQGFCGDR